MKRIGRQALIFLALLVIVALVQFPQQYFGEHMLKTVKDAASAQGFFLDSKSFSVKFPGRIAISDVRIGVPVHGLPLYLLSFSNVEITPAILPLLLLRASVAGKASGEFGILYVNLRDDLWGAIRQIALSGEKLELGRHPLISFYGVKGQLSLDLSATLTKDRINIEAVDRLELKASLENGEYAGGHSIRGLVKLPAITDISAALFVTGKGRKVDIDKFEVASSLGIAKGEGRVLLSRNGQFESGEFSGTINLTAFGSQAFGGYLALAAGYETGKPVDSAIRNWRVRGTFSGKGEPIVTVSPES